MQLRSGLLLPSSTSDTLPLLRKRKQSFQPSPSKRRKARQDPERNGNEGNSLRQKSGIHHSLESIEPQSRLKSFSGRATLGDKRPASSLQTWECSTCTEEPHLKRAPLTERNLKTHSRSIMPRPRKTPSTGSTTTTSTTTTTDKAFGFQLKKNGIIYGRIKTKTPNDITVVKESLHRARGSQSPVEKDYEHYVEQVEYCENEFTMQTKVWPLLAKDPCRTKTQGYADDYNFAWTEVESHLTSGLTDAKPDISEGYRKDQYPLDVCEALGGALAPTQYNGAMPTFCVEWKGPDGTIPSAEKQCAYDGALMVDAAFDAHRYMKKDTAEFVDKTQALTVALNGEIVHIYGNHVVAKGSSFEYHQYPLHTHLPGESFEAFKETYKQVRNAQDWARERATRTKDDLYTYSNTKRAAPITLAEPTDDPGATEKGWFWSAEHGKQYRILSGGSFQWSTPVPSAPAVTPPSTANSLAANSRGLKGKGKSKKKN
ncbi:hypothetical protein MMC30_007899 [Trapelia coarctata]|nr:hypothetical protein [Trapelia coarctata]